MGDVQVDTKGKTITITDDGHGMNQSDINDESLTVGYRRRDEPAEDTTPKHKRIVMGRKGIGKLPPGVETKAFAITVERETGSALPTSQLIMLGTGE